MPKVATSKNDIKLDCKIFLRNNEAALKWKIFKEHKKTNDEFKRIFSRLLEIEDKD